MNRLISVSYLFILISYLVLFVSPQLIVTSNNQQETIEKIITKYNNFFTTQLAHNLLSSNFTDLKESNIQITNIKFKSISLDLTKEPFMLLKRNILSYSPNMITLSFSFSYNIDSSSSTDGEFNFNIYSLLITEKDNKDKIGIEVSIDHKESDFVIVAPTDTTKANQLLQVISTTFMTYNKDTIISTMESSFKEGHDLYYADLPEITSYTHSDFGHSLIRISTNNFCGLCVDRSENGETAQCYYMGNVTDAKYYDWKDDAFGKNSFVQDNGSLKMFLHYRLFNDILYFPTKYNHYFTFKEENKPKEYSSKIKAQNLFYYFPNIQYLTSGNYPVSIKTSIDRLIFVDRFHGEADLLHKVDIGEGTTKIVQFKSFMTFTFELQSKMTSFNICAKDITVTNVQSASKDLRGRIENSKELIAEIQEILSMYNNEKQICAFDGNGIDMYQYVKLIENAEAGDRGIYIEGKQMYDS